MRKYSVLNTVVACIKSEICPFKHIEFAFDIYLFAVNSKDTIRFNSARMYQKLLQIVMTNHRIDLI